MDSSKNKTLKKVVKVTVVSVLSLLLLALLAIGIAVNFIFTPKKITPAVVDIANTYLNAKVDIKSVELTFFSTFPHFGLKVEDGSVVSNVYADSAAAPRRYQATDSLLSFKSCFIEVNPIALVTKNEIKVSALKLVQPKIYAYVSDSGKASWDIVKPSADTTAVQPTDTSASAFSGNIDIKNVSIVDGSLTFDDRFSKLYAQTKNMNFKLDGSLAKAQSSIAVDFSSKNIILWQSGKLLVRKLDFGVQADLAVNSISKEYKIESASMEVNGLKLGAKGSFKADTVGKTLDVNVGFGFKVSSLKTLLDLIPTSIVKEAADLKANGEVTMQGALKGVYGKNKLPALTVSLKVKDGAAKYGSMPVGIDKLDVDMDAYLDVNNKEKSFINLSRFVFKGGASAISCSTKIVDVLTDPNIATKLDAAVDFTSLSKIFPLQEGVSFGGKLDAKLAAKLKVSDIKKGNYGNVGIVGSAKISDVVLQSVPDTFNLNVKAAGLKFGANLNDTTVVQGKTLLNAVVGFDGLRMNIRKRIWLNMDKVGAHLKSSPLKDTSAIVSMSGTVGFARIEGALGDTVSLKAKGAKAQLAITPSPGNKKVPMLKSSFTLDTLAAGANGNRLLLDYAGFNLKSTRSEKNMNHWQSTGTVGFRKLKFFTPAFPLEMVVSNSQISLTPQDLVLNNLHVKLGRSNVTLSGKISNIVDQLFKNKFLVANLELSSEMINLNQIMRALDKGTQYTLAKNKGEKSPAATVKPEMEQSKLDSAEALTVFVIPKGIDFTFNTNIKKVKFGKLLIEDVTGNIHVRNQAIELTGVGLKTLGARMTTGAVYKASTKDSAYAAFILRMKDINIGNLVEFMPAMDTLVPMLKSFDGNVNCQLAMETKLDQNLNVIIPSINGAANLEGDSLVLFDSETFGKIAKMMMFKNKKRNVVDSISVFLQINKSVVDVYPFVLQMDRYKVAVGGDYIIDNKLNYHISVLKSPVPFKLGVDVYGTLDDIKFKITKAKYKNLLIPSKRTVVETKAVELQQNIRTILRGEPEK